MEELNMEQVIGMVLELEAQSQDIVRKASERREALPSDIEKRLEAMRKMYLKAADDRIEVIRAEESKRLDEELDKVRRSHANQMKRLGDAADRELERWSELIFNNVVEKLGN